MFSDGRKMTILNELVKKYPEYLLNVNMIDADWWIEWNWIWRVLCRIDRDKYSIQNGHNEYSIGWKNRHIVIRKMNITLCYMLWSKHEYWISLLLNILLIWIKEIFTPFLPYLISRLKLSFINKEKYDSYLREWCGDYDESCFIEHQNMDIYSILSRIL